MKNFLIFENQCGANLPYNNNFVVLTKKHVGGNRNLIINFAWSYHRTDFVVFSKQEQQESKTTVLMQAHFFKSFYLTLSILQTNSITNESEQLCKNLRNTFGLNHDILDLYVSQKHKLPHLHFFFHSSE